MKVFKFYRVMLLGMFNYKLEQLVQFTTSLFKLNQKHKHKPQVCEYEKKLLVSLFCRGNVYKENCR